MHSEGGNTVTRKRQNLTQWYCPDDTKHKHRQVALVSPLGPQRLSPQLDLESELWRRPRDHDGLGLRGLGEAVMLPLVLLVFFVFPLVNAVQARAAFTCRGEGRKAGIDTLHPFPLHTAAPTFVKKFRQFNRTTNINKPLK